MDGSLSPPGNPIVVRATDAVDVTGDSDRQRELSADTPPVRQSSIRDPSIRVRSRGRQKYSAPSVLSLDVAMTRFLRHAGMDGSPPFVSSIFDKKYEASSIAINPSVFVGSSST